MSGLKMVIYGSGYGVDRRSRYLRLAQASRWLACFVRQSLLKELNALMSTTLILFDVWGRFVVVALTILT